MSRITQAQVLRVFSFCIGDRDFSNFKICSEVCPLHNYFCLLNLFFFRGNFQNRSREKPPPVPETQHENSSVPIKLVQRQGFPSPSAGLTSSPVSSSYQIFRSAEISLLCLNLQLL